MHQVNHFERTCEFVRFFTACVSASNAGIMEKEAFQLTSGGMEKAASQRESQLF
jgi:hypothetical protein